MRWRRVLWCNFLLVKHRNGGKETATQNYIVAAATGTEQIERHGTLRVARGAGRKGLGEAAVVGAEVWRSLPP